MKRSKNIIIRSIGFGIIFLISCILALSAVSCHMEAGLQNTGKITIPRNITVSSIPSVQPESGITYFNDGSMECYCGHGTVFILNASLVPDTSRLENCVLEESIHSIMEDIDDACREYREAGSDGGTGNESPGESNNDPDTPDQDATQEESHQSVQGTSETADSSQESQQVLNTGDFIYSLLHLINTSRNQNGLPSLNLNSSVCDVASIRSQDMIDRNYFSHTTPEGKSIFNILQECGIAYGSAGENIQYSYPPSNASPGKYFNTWMASNIHRANILSANYSQIGIGVSFNSSRIIAVLVFVG